MTSPAETPLRGAAIRLAPVLLLVATMLAMPRGTRARRCPPAVDRRHQHPEQRTARVRPDQVSRGSDSCGFRCSGTRPPREQAGQLEPHRPHRPQLPLGRQRRQRSAGRRGRPGPGAPGRQRPEMGPALPDPLGPPRRRMRPGPDRAGTFATAAARRYSGGFAGLPRVKYWQALNEPNLSLFFFPQFNTAGKALSASLYKSLVNAFYDAVKAVDKSNLVIAAGLGPIAVPKWTIGPIRFTRELLCMQGRETFRPAPGKCAPVRFDIFAIQPYTTGGPTHVGGINDVQLGGLGRLKSLLVAADKAPPDQGRLQAHPALGDRVLLGHEAARSRRAADGNRDQVGLRGPPRSVEGGRQRLLLVQPPRRRTRHVQPPIQRDARVRPLFPRCDAGAGSPEGNPRFLPLPVRRLPAQEAGARSLGPDPDQRRRQGPNRGLDRVDLAQADDREGGQDRRLHRHTRRAVTGRTGRAWSVPSTPETGALRSRCAGSRTSSSRPSADRRARSTRG